MARRRKRGVVGWGRHLRSGHGAAAKETFALTHPSNPRETSALTESGRSFKYSLRLGAWEWPPAAGTGVG